MSSFVRTRAVATITVKSSKTEPFDREVKPTLAELSLKETFDGDLEGTSTVRALQIRGEDGSASMVSVQRFVGKLKGKQGTFVLQGSETIRDGKVMATWFVVSGSGTGELEGLRGEGGFEGEFGRGSKGTLDYWFEEQVVPGLPTPDGDGA